MVSSNAVVLCTYSYDPLDRLAGASPGGSDSVQRFYQKGDLTTEIQGQIQRAVFQSEDHLLARQQLQSGQTGCALLGTDQQRSVLHSLDPAQQRAFAYSPYGFRPPQLDLPGFNGEQPDPVTGHYLLGNGYRAFNPILMRFNSPDSFSPFGDGGLNAYAYCVGDPVNRVDPTGHTPAFFKGPLRRLGVMKKPQPIVQKALGKPTKPATNIKVIDEGVYSFEEVSTGGGKRLTIDAHGRRGPAAEYSQMNAGSTSLTPDHLNFKLQKAGVNYKKYDKIRLLMCHSATQGADSFAAEFSAIINRPVKGYRGLVWVTVDLDEVLRKVAGNSSSIRRLPNGTYHYDKGVQVIKKSQYAPSDPRYDYINYQPRTFEMTHF